MGVQLSWQSTCPASRGSSVRTRLPPPIWAHSSAGQSTRLISVRSMVRVHLSPPKSRKGRVCEKWRKPLGCIATKQLKSPFEPTKPSLEGSARNEQKAATVVGGEKKINNCIAKQSKFLFERIKTSTKGKKRNFHISKEKLIWLISKTF